MKTETKIRGMAMTARNVPKVMSGAKTQTRRIIKQQPHCISGSILFRSGKWICENYQTESKRPFDNFGRFDAVKQPYEIGDVLYIKEALAKSDDQDGTWARYKSDRLMVKTEIGGYRFWESDNGQPWKVSVLPARYMPRSAARTFIKITDVRCERIQDISEEDCQAEGCQGGNGSIPGYRFSATPREHFKWLWNETNGAGAWQRNDWTFAYTFELTERPA